MNRPGEAKPDLTVMMEELAPVLSEINKVIEYGQAKHGDRIDWQKHPKLEYNKAFYRHLLKGWSAMQIDDESTLPHVDHMILNLLYWRWHTLNSTRGNKPCN